MSIIVLLNTKQEIDKELIGSKAAGLIYLNKNGFLTPPGFCILSSAYKEHLKKNNLISNIESISDKIYLSDIRKSIINSPLDVEIYKEIEDHYRLLKNDNVAVRSSATLEDLPDYSFAGQYDTYLGITNLKDCISAVKNCWASLWTERAYDYRQKNGLDYLSVNMAVIIQALVRANASGILFTIDPVQGWDDRIIIEVCPGLGKNLVSGRITPDRFVINKNSLRILSKSISEDSPSGIDKSIIRSLSKLAKRVESDLNKPQDIEWAIQGKEIFLLQSRPITTIPKPRKWEDRQVWTNINLGEVLPDIITPLNWSLVEPLINTMFGSVFGWIGIEIGNNPLIGQIAGRAYFNLNTFASALRRFPGMKKVNLTKVLGGAQGTMGDLEKFEFADEDLPDLKFSIPKMLYKLPGYICKICTHSIKRGFVFADKIEKESKNLLKTKFVSLSDQELVSTLKFTTEKISRMADGIAFSGLSIYYFGMLLKFCRKNLDDPDGVTANRLLAGIGGIASADAGMAMWQLAVKARENPDIEKVIIAGNDWKITRKNISELENSNEFIDAWNSFMIEHGHHTRGELEVYNPRWLESPDYVLSIVSKYFENLNSINPVKDYEKRSEESKELLKKCRDRLKNPLKKLLFNFYFKQASQGCMLRENIKSAAARYWAGLRFIILQLGKRFAGNNIIKNSDDVFFLYLEEIESIIKRTASSDIQEVIEARQGEYKRNSDIIPPKVVLGRFDPDNFIPDKVEQGSKTLSGIPVSPGIVKGKARVILKSDTNEQLSAGEILVIPFSDPGWTPYYMSASAIVMDQGGLLSHGSIIAREYGIPTVVNVGPATKLIKTNQTIYVDANRGLVNLFPI